jgi:hypothetical protein
MKHDFPKPKYVPLDFSNIEQDEQIQRVTDFYENLNRRRTVREFSDQEVPFEIIEKAILTAGTGQRFRSQKTNSHRCRSRRIRKLSKQNA